MNRVLPRLWPFIDTDEPFVPSGFVANWPVGVLERLLTLGIIQPAENTEFVVCPHCCDHVEEVIALDGPDGRVRFMIPCPEFLRLEIRAELLKQWTLSLSGLVRALASAMRLSGKSAELVPNRLWRLGRLHTTEAVHDVLLVRRLRVDNQDIRAALGSSLRPIVLLADDAPRAVDWLGDRATYFSLQDIVSCNEAGIAVDCDDLLVLATRNEAESGAECSFRRCGEFWTVTFDRETAYFKDTVGFAYLARLLSEPNREIPAVTLLAAKAGIDPLVTTGSSGEVLDDEAREDYGRRYCELQRELENARENNDLGQVERLEGEMEQLTNELACATGLGGRSRKRTDIEKVRKSVTMAVSRGIERIGAQHKSLGRHLTTSITSGLTFRYAPERDPGWLT